MKLYTDLSFFFATTNEMEVRSRASIYCVKSATEGQLRSEVLADHLYRFCGVPVPVTSVATTPQNTFEKESTLVVGRPVAPSDYGAVAAHFVIDCWLANWNVIGRNFDNIIVKSDIPFRINNGGAVNSL